MLHPVTDPLLPRLGFGTRDVLNEKTQESQKSCCLIRPHTHKQRSEKRLLSAMRCGNYVRLTWDNLPSEQRFVSRFPKEDEFCRLKGNLRGICTIFSRAARMEHSDRALCLESAAVRVTVAPMQVTREKAALQGSCSERNPPLELVKTRAQDRAGVPLKPLKNRYPQETHTHTHDEAKRRGSKR